jgi:hypothetical protein
MHIHLVAKHDSMYCAGSQASMQQFWSSSSGTKFSNSQNRG